MDLTVLGWNFRNTPLEVRDRLAGRPEQQLELGQHLRARYGVSEVVLLGTCNRTELYLVNLKPPAEELLASLEDYWNIPELGRTHYLFQDLQAARHLFRVGASLDSMVVGEPQILGQLKDAFERFSADQQTGRILYALFTRAFSVAKKIRTETSIGDNAVSISYAAVELARRIFEDLSQLTVLVVGAGEMAELAIQHLLRGGTSQLKVTNRTFANAAKLAEKYQGSVIPFEQLERELHTADIVISSTGAQEYVLHQEQVQTCLKKRKGKSMFFIDIAVPRDIDPGINELPGVYCYDIDDLQSVVERNKEERIRQSDTAEKLISEELERVEMWFKSLSTVPLIRNLRAEFHRTAQKELDKTMARLHSLTPSQREEVQSMVRGMVNKLLHKPSTNLKVLSRREDMHLYLEPIAELFDLDPPRAVSEDTGTGRPALKLLKKADA